MTKTEGLHGFPIAMPEHGLSAYFFYAGVRYARNGRCVDNLHNVQAAALPTLEEGIEFTRPGV